MATLKFNAYDYEEGIVKSLAYNYDPLKLYSEAFMSGQSVEEGIFANDSWSDEEGTDTYDGSELNDYVITPWMQMPTDRYQSKIADLLFATTIRPYPAPEVHYRRIRVEDKMQSAPYVYIPNKVLDELCNNHSIGLDDPRRIPISFDEYYYKITAVTENPSTRTAYDYETHSQKTYKAFTTYFNVYDKNDELISNFHITQSLTSFGLYSAPGILFVPAVLTDFYSKYWAAQIDVYPNNKYHKWSTGSYAFDSIVSLTCVSIPEYIFLENPRNSGNYYRVKSIDITNLSIPKYFSFSTAQRISSSLAFNVNDGYLKVFDTDQYPVYTIEDENGNDIQMTGIEINSQVAPNIGLGVPVRIFDTSGTNKLLQYVGAYENSPAPEPEPSPDPDVPPTPDPQPDPDDDTDPVPTDNIDGTNGYTIPEINALHPANMVLYCMTSGELARFRGEIESVVLSRVWRTIAQYSDQVKLTDVIAKIIEYPFAPKLFIGRGQGLDYVEACMVGPEPMCSPLTVKPQKNSVTITGQRGVRALLRLLTDWTITDDDIDEMCNIIYGSVPASTSITLPLPNTSVRDYFNKLLNRWVSIDFGTEKLIRRQMNSLDFEATDYVLTLPLCSPIKLNNFDIFRSDGDPYTGTATACFISIQAILDIETGDMLYNVYRSAFRDGRDKQLIIQQGTNIASERQVIGTDTAGELREIGAAIKSTADIGFNTVSTVGWNENTTDQYSHKYMSLAPHVSGNNNFGTDVWCPTDNKSFHNYSTVDHYNDTDYASASYHPVEAMSHAIKSQMANMPITRGSTQGGAKLIANMIPYIDVYYPIPVISAKLWKKEMGLKSATFGYAKGYNKYLAVRRILDSTGTMTAAEREDLIKRLEGGFVYYGYSEPWDQHN